MTPYDHVITNPHSLVAMSILPVGTDTLVYGSSDAGRTVHIDNDLMNQSITK